MPFLVAGPGVPHGTRFDPITTEDVTATILDLGGARPPHPADGVSVVAVVRRATGAGGCRSLVEGQVDRPEINAAAARTRRPASHDALTGIGVRTARWKYVRYVDGDAELYDLDPDPNELHNVYGQPARTPAVQAAARTRSGSAPGLRRRDLPRAAARRPAGRAPTARRGTRAQERGVEARYGVELP